MIEDVFSEYEDVKWSNNSQYEIGFYWKDRKKRTEYFFGIWYDLWEHYEIPLSITFKFDGKAPDQWHYKLQTFIKSKYKEGILVKHYDGYTCLLFDYSFFKFDKGNDIDSLSNVYYDTTEYAENLLAK